MSSSAHRVGQAAHLDAKARGQRCAIPLRRVLLVDEQAHVLRVLRLNLERHGYEVDTALGADIALQQLRECVYEALIITSDLPDMSARQLCEASVFSAEGGELDGCEARPLILIGAGTDSCWIDESPFAERLEKPVSLRWIVARLSEVFGDYDQ